MIKKYKYFIAFLILIFLIPMFSLKFNNSVTTFNAQPDEYLNFVKGFFSELNESRNKNPIDISTYKSKGEIYIYNALNERERILNSYSYTENTVPPEYIDFHRKLVQLIITYKEAINAAKEGILLVNLDKVQEGVSKEIDANNMLIKLEEEFLSLQTPKEG